ncbi:MAG: hypothetical protein V1492_03780 [Candidatus Micrarchaeota archaeon]
MIKKYLKAGLLASSVIIAIAAAILCPPCDCGGFYGVQPLISPRPMIAPWTGQAAIQPSLAPYILYLAALVLAGAALAVLRIDANKYWKVGAAVTLVAYAIMFVKLVLPRLMPYEINLSTAAILVLISLVSIAINVALSAVGFAVAEKLKR